MTKSNEDAVSPVIGVILMVAVTVILAAVIAAFVFGMGTGVKSTKIVAASAQISGNNIIVTYQGGQNHGDLRAATPLKTNVTAGSGTPTFTDFGATVVVGDIVTIPRTGTTGPYHVSVAATFADGTSQVILDTNLGSTGV